MPIEYEVANDGCFIHAVASGEVSSEELVAYEIAHAWNLARFYEGMAMLHSPEIMIVFGDRNTAKSWLGVD